MKLLLNILQTIFGLLALGGFFIVTPMGLLLKQPVFMLWGIAGLFLGLPFSLVLKKINTPGYKFNGNIWGIVALIMMVGFGIVALYEAVSFQKTETIKQIKLTNQGTLFTGQFTLNDNEIVPGKQYDYVLTYSRTIASNSSQQGVFSVEVDSPLGQEKFEKNFSTDNTGNRHRNLSTDETSLKHYFYPKPGIYNFKISPNVSSSSFRISGITLKLVQIK